MSNNRGNPSLISFVILRLLCVPIIQTWFVPDETWQVTEVAHHIVFEYGYLTWEWVEGLRSILYPGLFAILFQLLKILHLDYIFLIVQLPRILSGLLFALGDFYFHTTLSHLWGHGSSGWIAVSLFTSWFLAYCAPRTLSSCLEMTLLAITLHKFPWHREKDQTNLNYLWWGGLGCVIRPTFATFLLPFTMRHFIFSRKKTKLALNYLSIIVSVLLLSVSLDSIYYGKLTVVPWNFFRFNVLQGHSAHYGTHPWHWYLTQGLPATVGLSLVPLSYGLYKNFNKYASIVYPCMWAITVHSFLGHKEFRFLLPILPLLLGVAGDVIHNYLQENTRIEGNDIMPKSMAYLLLLVIPNVLALFYMGCIHQRGPFDGVTALRTHVVNHPSPKVLFLTPCHSTPLYSHLHVNVSTRFLTCEPNLLGVKDYKDEADLFFEDPSFWLQKDAFFASEKSGATHLVMYDSLAIILEDFLQKNSFKLCSQIFNAHFYDGNRSKYLLIFCKYTSLFQTIK